MPKKPLSFEKSNELKRIFNELTERWCKKNRLDMADLAERCGVSLQYLSHIGRYGRIPSKPILTLLAFNLEVQEPAHLFRVAGIKEPWPYEQDIGLRAASATENGLLSVNLDMRGFATVIRDIVRAEIQPKRLEDLLAGRPLRVGLNRAQFFLFDQRLPGKAEGFFPELMRSIAVALNCTIEFSDVSHIDFQEKLEQGKIDCFGPVYKTAARLTKSQFSQPFCAVPVAGLMRTKKAPPLVDLPEPKRFADLQQRAYVIAVHRESMAHHFAASVLGIESQRLIACDESDEALERIILTKLPRAAHLMLTDLPFAQLAQRQSGSSIKLTLTNEKSDTSPFEDTIAVRSDWIPLANAINQSLEFLQRNGAITRIEEKTLADFRGVIEVIS